MPSEGNVGLACADVRFCVTDSLLTNRLIQQMEERAPLTAQRALIAWVSEPMSISICCCRLGAALGFWV